MKKLKLFSLALMAMFSVSMWATDFTLYGNSSAPSLPMSADGIKITGASTGSKNGSSQCSEIDGIPSTKIYMVSLSSGGMLTVDAGTSNYIVSVSFVAGRNSSGSTVSQFGHGGFSNDSTTWSEIGAISAKGYDKGSVINVTPTGKYRYYSFGRAKLGSTSPSTNAEARIYTISVTIESRCQDPNASMLNDSIAYVKDSIDLKFTTSNTNAADTVVKLDGNAAVEGEGNDYKFVAGKGFVPLKAGVFKIFISQDADATYCAVEDSVALTIGEKNPVTAVTIGDAAHTARIGGSVELTATAANATVFQWAVNGTNIDGATTASYTFNATAVGEYSFVCKARNDFNTLGDSIVSSAHVITVAKSSDATLSDLKVNGTTVADFTPTTTDYNIGEIGVYEKLTITYTVNDEGYASATLKQANIKDGKDTVVVTAEDGTTVNNYIISFTRAAATELVSISASTTWDFTQTGSSEVKFTASTLPAKDIEFNFADVLPGPAEAFKASALLGAGEYAVRGGEYFQGNYVKFNTTVAGTMTVVYSNTSDRKIKDGETEGQESLRRFLTVNDALVAGDAGTMKQGKANATTVEDIAITAGNVKLGAVCTYSANPTDAQYLRIYSIVFSKSPATALDNTANEAKVVKFIENGQVVIFKDGKYFNVLGIQIR